MRPCANASLRATVPLMTEGVDQGHRIVNGIASAIVTIEAEAEVIFDVLTDPSKHAAIDGTGWICEALDSDRLTEEGQIFRMGMYHPKHPDGEYATANEVQVLDRPNAISWKPGYETGDGTLAFGGWVWRYDLRPVEPRVTEVTLSYDWSAITDEARQVQSFPPFPLFHLSNSLAHLAELSTAVIRRGQTRPSPGNGTADSGG